MRRFFLVAAVLLPGLIFTLGFCSFRTPDERAAAELARRVMGPKASAVVFEQIDSEVDTYEIRQSGGRVLIRGSNANSMAVGLNRYLQEYCLANVS